MQNGIKNQKQSSCPMRVVMKAKINVGRDLNGKDIVIDLQEEKLHTIILAGETGSGKSVFHENLYKQLMAQNSSEELGFVFFDMTRVDFTDWNSPYLYMPVIFDSEKALTAFEKLGEESILRANNKTSARRTIFIHIEECDMICLNKKRFEKAWLNIAKNKEKNNMYLVFSTSALRTDVFTKIILENTDLKVICKVTSKEDSLFILGKSLAEKFKEPGEKVLVYNNREVLSLPFKKDMT